MSLQDRSVKFAVSLECLTRSERVLADQVADDVGDDILILLGFRKRPLSDHSESLLPKCDCGKR